MAARKMDGTVRKPRQPKRSTKELPFWMEMQFVRAYKAGLARFNGQKSEPILETSPTDVAGYAAGRAGLDEKQAFVGPQEFAAAHGFHRD